MTGALSSTSRNKQASVVSSGKTLSKDRVKGTQPLGHPGSSWTSQCTTLPGAVTGEGFGWRDHRVHVRPAAVERSGAQHAFRSHAGSFQLPEGQRHMEYKGSRVATLAATDWATLDTCSTSAHPYSCLHQSPIDGASIPLGKLELCDGEGASQRIRHQAQGPLTATERGQDPNSSNNSRSAIRQWNTELVRTLMCLETPQDVHIIVQDHGPRMDAISVSCACLVFARLWKAYAVSSPQGQGHAVSAPRPSLVPHGVCGLTHEETLACGADMPTPRVPSLFDQTQDPILRPVQRWHQLTAKGGDSRNWSSSGRSGGMPQASGEGERGPGVLPRAGHVPDRHGRKGPSPGMVEVAPAPSGVGWTGKDAQLKGLGELHGQLKDSFPLMNGHQPTLRTPHEGGFYPGKCPDPVHGKKQLMSGRAPGGTGSWDVLAGELDGVAGEEKRGTTVGQRAAHEAHDDSNMHGVAANRTFMCGMTGGVDGEGLVEVYEDSVSSGCHQVKELQMRETGKRSWQDGGHHQQQYNNTRDGVGGTCQHLTGGAPAQRREYLCPGNIELAKNERRSGTVEGVDAAVQEQQTGAGEAGQLPAVSVGSGARGMKSRFLRIMGPLVSQQLKYYRPRQLANTLYALALMKEKPRGLLAPLLHKCLDSLSDYTPQELANVVWAMEVLRLCLDSKNRQKLLLAVDHCLLAFNIQELVIVLWALSKRQVRSMRSGAVDKDVWVDEERVGKFLQHAGGLLPEASAQHISLLIWSLGKLRYGPPLWWFQAWQRQSYRMLPSMTPQHLSSICWGLGILGAQAQLVPRWRTSFLSHMKHWVPRLRPIQMALFLQGVCMLQWSLSRELLDEILSSVVHNLTRYEPVFLAETALTLSRLIRSPSFTFLLNVYEEAHGKLSQFTPVSTVCLLTAAVNWKFSPGDIWLADLLRSQNLSHYTGAHLVTLLRCLGKLGWRPERDDDRAWLLGSVCVFSMKLMVVELSDVMGFLHIVGQLSRGPSTRDLSDGCPLPLWLTADPTGARALRRICQKVARAAAGRDDEGLSERVRIMISEFGYEHLSK